jgi:hypothetical protein
MVRASNAAGVAAAALAERTGIDSLERVIEDKDWANPI